MKNIKSFDEINENENEYHINEAMKPERMKVVTDFYTLIASKATPEQVKSFLNTRIQLNKSDMAGLNKNSTIIVEELLNGITNVSMASPEAFNIKANRPGAKSSDTVKSDIQTILKYGGLG